MEINTYCIPTGKRAEVEKLIARYQKKAARYGVTLETTFGEPYIKKVAVYENDYIKQEYVHVGDYHYEVCDLEIKSEIIKQNGWEVVAMIEHLDGGNIVTMADDIKPEWLTMPPYCEHCKGNHGQRTTFIVRHESGAEKQVGKTCLKEFCVIDLDENGEEVDRCYGFIIADCEIKSWADSDATYKRLVCNWEGIKEEETRLEMIDGYHTYTKYDYRVA